MRDRSGRLSELNAAVVPYSEHLSCPVASTLNQRGTAFECTNAEGPGTIAVYNQSDDILDGQNAVPV